MKKRLLTLGALALVISTNAQVVTTQFTTVVANNASVYASNKSLIYNGGGVKTIEDGKIDNSGNIMVVGNNNSKFATVTSAGADKVNGGNIIMNMTNETVGSLRYGQLYVKGLAQANITGVVDKEFKDVANGTYQQMALPFYNKLVSELSGELGKTFSNTRWSKNEILVYDNASVKSDLVNLSSRVQNPTAYYMLGSQGFDAANAVKVVKGIPYADGISVLLKDAGNGVDFGAGGAKPNIYRERYNSYLQDLWDHSSNAWVNNYGKNIYQFGNPYLTNLDLGQLGKVIPNLQGVRIESEKVVSIAGVGTKATSAKVVSYASGVAVGDNNAIIRPMQTFVVKLSDNRGGVNLNFDDLRRFAYSPRIESEPYKVNALSVSNEGNPELVAMSSGTSRLDILSSSTVKQLAVIALNSEGEEIGRTYYVVYADGVSGKPENVSAQAIASSRNIIGTFEETKNGGLDEELSTSYWLYINETNENDFKGKEVPLRLYSDEIKSLKFEIKENASEIKEGQEKLSSGESFYINLGNKNIVAVNNGKTVPLSSTSTEFGLYYGKPSPEIDNITPSNVAKPSETFVAFDTNDNNYKLIFDSSWKSANVQIFDMSGRLILSQNNVNTMNNFVINLPSGKGVYIVNAISETGHKFSQKIVK